MGVISTEAGQSRSKQVKASRSGSPSLQHKADRC